MGIHALVIIPMAFEAVFHLSPVIGEVIEVYHSDGASVATVSLRALHVSIPADLLDDPHLGEQITLDVDLTVRGFRAAKAGGNAAGGRFED
jgi:hypothetical protein